MKNILSIDFDIIMAPSIELYNNKVPQSDWEESLLQDPYFQLATADLIHYHRLTYYLLYLTTILPKEKIHFVFDHEQIAFKLAQTPEEKYVITNIDHHHDIAYHDNEIEFIQGPPSCANWAKWLIDRNMVHRYRWINNYNSAPVYKKELEPLINTIIDFREFNFDNQTDPDEVFIVMSPPWVPPMYQNLFYCWMDMLNRIYNTHYNFEDWRPKDD